MTTVETRSVVRLSPPGPISGSEKIYRGELGVPARRVHLTNGEHFDLYDTSGPYTDASATIDVTGWTARAAAGLDRRTRSR